MSNIVDVDVSNVVVEISNKELNNIRLKQIRRLPELVPLTEEQKEAFLFFWNAMPQWSRRQKLISEIPSLYGNRKRYRELLPDKDKEMFNEIMNDPNTVF